MLPGWFGFGSAAAKLGVDKLRPIYKTSPSFRTTVANMEMVLAKSSMPIARRYSELVEDRELAKEVFSRIEAEWQATVNAVLAISEQKSLLQTDPRLMASIQSRLPYVNALNHLQVDLLRRRRAGDADEETHRGIHMSINGVSAGLRNSG
jgi:phosphoenolpyruvate carboxylase